MLSIPQYVLVYGVSTVIFFIVDMIWLGFVAKDFYRKQIGHLLSDTVQWPVAITFYLLFLLGLLVFVIAPALESRSIFQALMYGALFGFFTYATYDLTNWSTLRDWPALVSIVDMIWGTVLSTVVAGSTYWIVTTFFLK